MTIEYLDKSGLTLLISKIILTRPVFPVLYKEIIE